MSSCFGLVLGLLLVACQEPADDQTVFSGPQAGEALPSFRFREILVAAEGREVDLVEQAGDGVLLLVFVHQVNRPAIGFTRVLTGYAHKRLAEGLTTGVIFLENDVAAAEATVKRIEHALAKGVPTGVALEGQEGPGSYGLNRHVTLTILVAQRGRVTANFALVQPSLQVDLPRVLEAIVGVLGGTVPSLEELGVQGLEGPAGMKARPDSAAGAVNSAPNLRPLLAPLINKNASDEQVIRAAEAIEQAAGSDLQVRQELGRIARTIVSAGVVGRYGTAKAQEYLRKWADEFGPSAKESPPR